jgi:phosphopantetheine--protein transferase-like protein
VGEVVVCGKLGQLAQPRLARTGLAPVAEASAGRVGELALDPAAQSFLSDHVINGVPVLPGVVGLELMERAAREMLGGAAVAVEDAAFERPVKAHPGRPIRVTARANRDGEAVECVLESHSVAATGKPIDAVHFRARFRAAGTDSAVDLLPPLLGLDERGPEAAEIYRRFFHGPTFQVLLGVTRIGVAGLVARARIPAVQERDLGDLVAPRLREIALQAAGLWAMCRHGVTALPHRIGRCERVAVPAERAVVIARVHALGTRVDGEGAPRRHAFDVELLAEDGAVFERLREVELIETGALPAGRPATVPFAESPEHVEVRLDVLAGAVDVVAPAYLGPAEASLFRQIGSRKRRIDWLGGRVAAKRLVAGFLLECAGVRVAEQDIGVVSDPRGAPVVRVAGRPDLEQLVPNVAISHGAGRAIAVLAPRNHGTRVGVDLERVEPRDAAFVRHVLTDGEIRVAEAAGLNGDGHTLLWTLKEAVSKALGVGMTIDPREIEVRSLRDGVAEVGLAGEAAERREALGGRTLTVRYALGDDASTAWAVLDVEPSAARPAPVASVPLPPGLVNSGWLGSGSC